MRALWRSLAKLPNLKTMVIDVKEEYELAASDREIDIRMYGHGHRHMIRPDSGPHFYYHISLMTQLR